MYGIYAGTTYSHINRTLKGQSILLHQHEYDYKAIERYVILRRNLINIQRTKTEESKINKMKLNRINSIRINAILIKFIFDRYHIFITKLSHWNSFYILYRVESSKISLLNNIDFLIEINIEDFLNALSLLIAQQNEIYIDNTLFELYLFKTFVLKLIVITNASFLNKIK